MTATSPTFDEAFYIARGWAWWRTGRLFTLGHPALASQLASLGLLLEPALPEPDDLAGWADGNAETFSEDLLWAHGLNAGRIVFLGRFPFLLISIALGALTAHWARRLYGPAAGLVALSLHAISPNILANAALAATDLPVAAFYVAAWFALLRALQRPTLPSVALGGALLGLAQASKFSALVLGPTLALWIAWLTWRERRWQPLAVGAATVGVGLLTLWATDGFALRPYPLAQYFAELAHLVDLAGTGHGAYLLGELSPDGWWYYHPVVLLVKTPLPVFILIGLSAIGAWQRRGRSQGSPLRGDGALLLPAGVFLAFTMVGRLNVGYRYLVPMLPLLHIFAAGAVRVRTSRRALHWAIAGALGAWSLWGLVQVHPNYLAYFNEITGGPDNGWRVLADSNLDWGQSLPALATALRERGAEHVFLSYFGQADPAYYGIEYTSLPGWPPPSPEPDFDPLSPKPGLYAISASSLAGVQLYEPNALAWFRQREPVAIVDHTFFLYEVPARDPGQWFYQCGAPVPLLNAREVRDLTGVRGLAQASFNCETALLLGEGPGWVLLPEELPPVIELGAPDYVWQRADRSTYYRVYYLPADWQPAIPQDAALTFGEGLTLFGATVDTPAARPGDTVHVTALWRVKRSLPPPLSIYAHLLTPESALAAAGDTLGAPPEQWRTGDSLVQQHALLIPPDAPAGEYPVFLGLYRLDTGERYTTLEGVDGVQVGMVIVTK